jgi:hypothetical protein
MNPAHLKLIDAIVTINLIKSINCVPPHWVWTALVYKEEGFPPQKNQSTRSAWSRRSRWLTRLSWFGWRDTEPRDPAASNKPNAPVPDDDDNDDKHVALGGGDDNWMGKTIGEKPVLVGLPPPCTSDCLKNELLITALTKWWITE